LTGFSVSGHRLKSRTSRKLVGYNVNTLIRSSGWW
jgi:hypothetical protein